MLQRRRFSLRKVALVTIAIGIFPFSAFIVSKMWWKQHSPTSAEGLLYEADKLAWDNNWLGALPIYVKAEKLFQKRGDFGAALYAHVSQFPVRMESSDLSTLIAELDQDLQKPAAASPKTRLRILEMKAKCEQEYDAGLAARTFAEVERLAISERHYRLASRASGEQGILAFELGNVAEAASKVKRAYAIAKYLGDPAAHVRYAEIIGLGMEHLGRPKQALQFLDEAIEVQKQHPEVARPYVAYDAKVASLGDLGRYGEALSLADQVVVFPREHHFYGQLESLLTSRADVLVKAGKTGEALTSYQDALKYAKLIRSWRAITMIDAKIAAQYERQGALTDALNAINEAIEANKQNPQEIFLVPRSIAIKARVLAKLGQHASAEGLYRKGVDVLDALLARVPTPEIERLVLTELGDLYSGYFELLSNEGRYADAFHAVEQARGRIEAQELEYDHTETPHSLTVQDELLRKLEIDLVETDDQVQRTRILRQVKTAQENAPMERTDEKTTTLAELQKQLNPDELYVEYVLADPQSYALAITRSQVKRYSLPTKTALEEESTKYRDTLRKQRTDSKLGQQLFRELLGFTHDFPDTRSTIIVADGALHLLPIGALIDESGKYVIEKQPVTMSPSGTVLVLLRSRVEKPTTTRPYLGVAAWTEAADKRPWVLQKISTDHKRGDLSALPASRDEVESIGAIMPQPSTMLFGRQATKAEFQSLPLGDYRILHLASWCS